MDQTNKTGTYALSMAQKTQQRGSIPEKTRRRREKRNEKKLRRNEECRDTHFCGEYFKAFGDEIPQPATQSSETNSDVITIPKPAMDTDLTALYSLEDTVTTQEMGAYPGISLKAYRDGPVEEIAVHYVRINRIIKNQAKCNRQEEENVRSAELDFMLFHLETLIKETAADPDLIKVQCCMEDNKLQ